jgi:HTH-type transcriptional regulator/antitoxin HigA
LNIQKSSNVTKLGLPMDINSITNEEDYENILREIEQLWDSPIDSPEGVRLELLVTVIEAYDVDHYPIPAIDDPIGVLEYLLESKGLSQTDLVPYIGSKECVSEIFTHKRQLSTEMIQRLIVGLNIPTDLLIEKSSKRDSTNY